MRKNFHLTAYVVFACLVVAFGSLFYLTQRNYILLKISNEAVINTGNVTRAHEQLSADFKNALIYISALRDSSNKKQYEDIYATGLWQIGAHLEKLKSLLDEKHRLAMDSLSKLMEAQVNWLMRRNASMLSLDAVVNDHIRKISEIQTYLDKQASDLERESLADVVKSEDSLVSLHNWIVTIIVTSSLIIFLTLSGIYLQFNRLEKQNDQLRQIAWIQSHEVRSQVAILLGLGEVLNHHSPDDPDHPKILAGIMSTTKKLDEIVHEINRKAEV